MTEFPSCNLKATCDGRNPGGGGESGDSSSDGGGGSRQSDGGGGFAGSGVRTSMSKAEYFFKSQESLATVIDNEEDVGCGDEEANTK